MAPLSNAERAEVCWHGRQEILALISEPVVGGWEGDVVADASEIRFSPVEGDKVISTSFHQSNSSTFLIPVSKNHFFKPKPTKNWAFG